MQLDNKDLTIISLLKDNARLSVRDVAKKAGIRPSTVHQRITQLKKKGIIEKYTLKLNNKEVGENFIVFLLIKTKPSSQLDRKIIDNQHVKEIFGITGEYDLLLKLKFKDIEEFNDFILRFRKEQSVVTTLTTVVTATVKEEL
ncbi:MAG TPA: Lrp/AsnC family transcriptional regulator [Candidatus Nanoarchaeia archaeon]|nr:Lrp/AsnC family transcriptional regulator [Candidatus Nanoarchaeia archaeon]